MVVYVDFENPDYKPDKKFGYLEFAEPIPLYKLSQGYEPIDGWTSVIGRKLKPIYIELITNLTHFIYSIEKKDFIRADDGFVSYVNERIKKAIGLLPNNGAIIEEYKFLKSMYKEGKYPFNEHKALFKEKDSNSKHKPLKRKQKETKRSQARDDYIFWGCYALFVIDRIIRHDQANDSNLIIPRLFDLMSLTNDLMETFDSIKPTDLEKATVAGGREVSKTYEAQIAEAKRIYLQHKTDLDSLPKPKAKKTLIGYMKKSFIGDGGNRSLSERVLQRYAKALIENKGDIWKT